MQVQGDTVRDKDDDSDKRNTVTNKITLSVLHQTY